MKQRFVLFLALLLSPSSQADSGVSLRVLYDLRPPLVELRNGQMAGLIGKRASQALRQAGIAPVWTEMPVSRQDAEIEHAQEAVCALGRLRSPQRALAGLFSQSILRGPRYVALMREDRSLPQPASLANWASQPGLYWGIQRGLFYGETIDALIHKSRAVIVPVTRTGNNLILMLISQRVDFLLLQEDEAKAVLNSAEASNLLRISYLDDLTAGEERFFYCSRQTPMPLLAAINAALAKLPVQ